MALMPKRVKHRKSQRGRIKGNATRGNRVVFGDYGLQSVQAGWIKAATIEAGRRPPPTPRVGLPNMSASFRITAAAASSRRGRGTRSLL